MLLELLFQTAGIWFPILIIVWCFTAGRKMWITYVNKSYLSNLKWVLLEIKMPQDVHKTPEAMELILGNIFYQTGGVGSWNDRLWTGKVLAYTTLEIVSIGGSIHFYIRAEARFKNLIETQVYAQYPRAEIFEVEDYTKKVPQYDKKIENWELRATEFKLSGDDAIPIKTYIDYGLDNNSLSLDEEQRLDPLTPLIEMMASLKAEEQLWIQIFIRASGKKLETTDFDAKKGTYKKDFLTRFVAGTVLNEGERFLHIEDKDKNKISWEDQGKAKIKELIEGHSGQVLIKKAAKEGDKDEVKNIGGYKNLSPMDKHTVDIIQRSLMKFGFDVGMRAVYYVPKDKFNGMRVPAELTSAMRQFAAPGYNGIGITGFTRGWDFATWQDPTGKRSRDLEEKMFEAYVKRAYFYHEAEGEIFDDPKKPFTLNTEELATIFHFPGRTITTPSFTRVESQKSGPPPNLPIG